MRFKELYGKISPRLMKIANIRASYNTCVDAKDLYQEMSLYVWDNYKDGLPSDINENYVIKGCEFYILNYIRKNKDKALTLSIEDSINDDGDTLKDIIADENEPLDRAVERKLVFEKIMNNGFTKMEKNVLTLLLKGLTVRETAKELGVSHVMVVKYKKRISEKWHEKGYQN